MPEAVYLGIDPGVSGGLAWLSMDSQGGCTYKAVRMPRTFNGILDWFRQVSGSFIPRVAMIEKVGGYISGSGGNIGSAMFEFGKSYGSLLMALTVIEIPFDEVHPLTWQGAYSLSPRKGLGKGERKSELKGIAQQLFPREKVTLATADAFLIAEYCRRKNEGRLE